MFENSQTKQSISLKLVFFYVVLVLDLFSASLVETHLDKNSSVDGTEMAIPLLIIQMVITLLLILSFFILLWQVFPLRQAMIGELWKCFHSHIKISLLFMIVSIVERFLRLIIFLDKKEKVDSEIWDDTLYTVMYYCKFVLQPFAYGKLIDGTMKLAMPEFYKPNKWVE